MSSSADEPADVAALGNEGADQDALIARWMLAHWSLALQSIVLSIGVAGVVGLLLFLSHDLMSRQPAIRLPIVGTTIDLTPIVGGGALLPVLLLTMGAWVLLSSTGHLMMARRVRNHLGRLGGTDRPEPVGAAGSDTALTIDAITERTMLETYLGLVQALARALAVSVLLILMLPTIVTIGLLAAWSVTGVLCLRRFRGSQVVSDEFFDASQQRIREPGAVGHQAVVEAMYLRETSVFRLPVGQVALLVTVMLAFVVTPAWLVSDGVFPLTAFLLIIMWIQAILATAMTAGTFGFQSANWLRKQSAPGPPTPMVVAGEVSVAGVGPNTAARPVRAECVALCPSPPDAWPFLEAVWVRPGADWPTLVAVPGQRWGIAGLPAITLAQRLADIGVNLLVLRDMPFAGGAFGYGGLGHDLDGVVASLPVIVDAASTLVVGVEEGCAVADRISRALPDSRLVAIARPGSVIAPDDIRFPTDDANALYALDQAGALAATVHAWLVGTAVAGEPGNRSATVW